MSAKRGCKQGFNGLTSKAENEKKLLQYLKTKDANSKSNNK